MRSAGWYLYLISGGELGCNPLDSRFRGNDGVKIGNIGAVIGNIGVVIASLRPSRLRAIASNSLCQHALAVYFARRAIDFGAADAEQ